MKIVVVGNGKVGRTLVEQLSTEGHDVFVIDINRKTLDETTNSCDVMGVCGSGANFTVQKEAGVDKADLLIACTDLDELNMLCCIVAKKLGARNAIARIRNPEYNDQLYFMQDELGLSMAINPELAAAKEMYLALRFPDAMKIEHFSGGRVSLMEIKVDDKSLLDGVTLKELSAKFKARVLVCAVQHDGGLIIPNGSYCICAGDKLNITGATTEIEKFLSAVGAFKRKVKNAMVVGGGKISYYLSRMLCESGIKVKIIERNLERCKELCELLPKAYIVNGDGTDHELLSEEGIENTDALAMLTGYDEQNIILSMYASRLNVGKTVTKVNNTSLAEIMETENSVNNTIITPKEITANNIISYVRAMQNSVGSNIETLHKLVGGRAEALEFRVSENFPQKGVLLKHLNLKSELLVACITRGTQIIIPGGDDCFQTGDKVIVVIAVKEGKGRFDDLSHILAD